MLNNRPRWFFRGTSASPLVVHADSHTRTLIMRQTPGLPLRYLQLLCTELLKIDPKLTILSDEEEDVQWHLVDADFETVEFYSYIGHPSFSELQGMQDEKAQSEDFDRRSRSWDARLDFFHKRISRAQDSLHESQRRADELRLLINSPAAARLENYKDIGYTSVLLLKPPVTLQDIKRALDQAEERGVIIGSYSVSVAGENIRICISDPTKRLAAVDRSLLAELQKEEAGLASITNSVGDWRGQLELHRKSRPTLTSDASRYLELKQTVDSLKSEVIQVVQNVDTLIRKEQRAN